MKNKKDYTIYLDMDGVCCDFVSASLTIFNKLDLLKIWPPGERNIPKVLNVPEDEFWKKLDIFKSDYWHNMREYPWFKEMYNYLMENYKDIYFLSRPSRSSWCVKGKLDWLYDRFGFKFDKYIFTSHKNLLANKKCILIDDDEKNIESFIKNKGKAILFPQPWNMRYNELYRNSEFLLDFKNDLFRIDID